MSLFLCFQCIFYKRANDNGVHIYNIHIIIWNDVWNSMNNHFHSNSTNNLICYSLASFLEYRCIESMKYKYPNQNDEQMRVWTNCFIVPI